MAKGSSYQSTFTIITYQGDTPDFASIWSAKPYSCDASRTDVPFSPLEETAYGTSKYTAHDISTLYTICAQVAPDDVDARPDFVPSEGQIAEINAALVLCPKHPHGDAWRQAVQRGKSKADLKASGQIFGSGTYLAGKEIQPGSYFVEGDIKGCYWERQDSSGGTIANDFVIGARRVQVTIKSTDYAFHSEGCGEWAPVG